MDVTSTKSLELCKIRFKHRVLNCGNINDNKRHEFLLQIACFRQNSEGAVNNAVSLCA